MTIILIKLEIRGNIDDWNMLRDGLTQRWRRLHKRCAADNSHPGNDDFRAGFYKISRQTQAGPKYTHTKDMAKKLWNNVRSRAWYTVVMSCCWFLTIIVFNQVMFLSSVLIFTYPFQSLLYFYIFRYYPCMRFSPYLINIRPKISQIFPLGR